MIITPKRNIFQRAINRAGRRFGIMPFPVRFENPLSGTGQREQVFDEIYDGNYWGSGESLSGPGSELDRTGRYRAALLDLLRRRNIDSVFDAPCGDLNWMRLILDEWPMHFEGGDIAPQALEAARKRCPNAQVYKFDICSDPFPDLQVWHCRDALFHLSFADIRLALENAAASRIEYALITTNRSRLLTNLDVATGGMRYVDFERSPFLFPRAMEYLPDSEPGGFPRFVGLWPMTDIRHAVQAMKRW